MIQKVVLSELNRTLGEIETEQAEPYYLSNEQMILLLNVSDTTKKKWTCHKVLFIVVRSMNLKILAYPDIIHNVMWLPFYIICLPLPVCRFPFHRWRMMVPCSTHWMMDTQDSQISSS